jgi:hypothetical protein
MAGLFSGTDATPGAAHNLICATNHSISGALRFAGGMTVGKFFLFIVAVSVAILLAMSIYIITL